MIALRTPALFLCAALASQAMADSVSLTIATEQSVPVMTQHKWSRKLAEAGISRARLRSFRRGDLPGVEAVESRGAKVYMVTGVLDRSGRLHVPGGKFTLRDLGKLRDYLHVLKVEGEQGVTAARGRFNLTKAQFESVFTKIGRVIDSDTQGMPLAGLLDRAARQTGMPVSIDRGLRPTVERLKVRDRLRTLSLGCGLAIALKAEGMAFAPEKPTGAPIRLRVGLASDLEEAWPIGWPTDRRTSELAPVMVKRINVEIGEGFKLSEVVGNIAPRLEIPFLWDHAALAKKRIDPAQVDVRLPAATMTYRRILDRLLVQAKLHGELRADEAGTAFYWVTR